MVGCKGRHRLEDLEQAITADGAYYVDGRPSYDTLEWSSLVDNVKFTPFSRVAVTEIEKK